MPELASCVALPTLCAPKPLPSLPFRAIAVSRKTKPNSPPWSVSAHMNVSPLLKLDVFPSARESEHLLLNVVMLLLPAAIAVAVATDLYSTGDRIVSLAPSGMILRMRNMTLILVLNMSLDLNMHTAHISHPKRSDTYPSFRNILTNSAAQVWSYGSALPLPMQQDLYTTSGGGVQTDAGNTHNVDSTHPFASLIQSNLFVMRVYHHPIILFVLHVLRTMEITDPGRSSALMLRTFGPRLSFRIVIVRFDSLVMVRFSLVRSDSVNM